MDTIRAVYEQQKYIYDNRTHSVPDRIVSVSQPFVRLMRVYARVGLTLIIPLGDALFLQGYSYCLCH